MKDSLLKTSNKLEQLKESNYQPKKEDLLELVETFMEEILDYIDSKDKDVSEDLGERIAKSEEKINTGNRLKSAIYYGRKSK